MSLPQYSLQYLKNIFRQSLRNKTLKNKAMSLPQKTECVIEWLRTTLKGRHGELISIHHSPWGIARSQGPQAISPKPILSHAFSNSTKSPAQRLKDKYQCSSIQILSWINGAHFLKIGLPSQLNNCRFLITSLWLNQHTQRLAKPSFTPIGTLH